MYTVIWLDLSGPDSAEYDTLDRAKERIASLVSKGEIPQEHIFLLEGRILPFTYGVVIGESEPVAKKKRGGRPKGSKNKPKAAEDVASGHAEDAR